MINLRIGKLLRRPEQSIPRIADSHINLTHPVERIVYDCANAGLVRKIKHHYCQAIIILLLQVGKRVHTPYGSHNPITTSEKLLRHQTTETRRRASNEPS